MVRCSLGRTGRRVDGSSRSCEWCPCGSTVVSIDSACRSSSPDGSCVGPTVERRTPSLRSWRFLRHACKQRRRNKEGAGAGANIPCLQARTCLETRNPCLKVRKYVLELLDLHNHIQSVYQKFAVITVFLLFYTLHDNQNNQNNNRHQTIVSC